MYKKIQVASTSYKMAALTEQRYPIQKFMPVNHIENQADSMHSRPFGQSKKGFQEAAQI